MSSVRLVLASASPRRVELLRGVGLSFEVIPSGIDETGPLHDPSGFARAAARDKGLAVAKRFAAEDHVAVLSADTIVVVDGEIFGKPVDAADAERMLGRLAGRTHQVLTGFTLLRAPATIVHEEVVSTAVTFRALGPREVRGYVATGEVSDKAGAYAAQGFGMFLIERVDGSYSNVVGLPVCEVVQALERHGLASLFPAERAP